MYWTKSSRLSSNGDNFAQTSTDVTDCQTAHAPGGILFPSVSKKGGTNAERNEYPCFSVEKYLMSIENTSDSTTRAFGDP